MNILKSILIGLLPIVMTIVGVLVMVYGEIDDSPGLWLIGLVIIVTASLYNINRNQIKKSN
ncbi:MAG: hypothetical protein HOG40_06735 [Cryomorphaceae bacterium]|jgi:hypothetical protein|nr:hypothetical protein [Cryomorphaceae bacterium]